MISLGYYCSTRHFFTTYCVNCACVDRTTPTYCKILPIILGIILNSFVHLLFSKLCWNNLSSPTCHQERGTKHSGETPLMIASRGGHVDIVRLLIEAKAQVNTQKEVW